MPLEVTVSTWNQYKAYREKFHKKPV
jgi:hypothetical protein